MWQAKHTWIFTSGRIRQHTMPVCQHRSFECFQVSVRGTSKCITNFTRTTTVAHVIDALLDDLSEKRHLTSNDCCLYMERAPYLFPLKSSDFIQDILLRYASANIQFKLSFKRNASPSRFAQRKRLLRTTVPPSTIPNAYEQLRIQESLIRRQHEIITQLRKTSLSRDHSRAIPASNYDNYFDWVTRQDDDDDDENQEVESDDGRSSSDSIPVSRRQSRQDDYLQAVHREAFEPIRSLSRVRFRPSTVSTKHDLPSPSIAPMRSILKKSTDEPISQRSSSVDRDITRLTSLKQQRHSVYTSDDADDDNLSDRSTTDSCLGSLSSNDSCSYLVNSQQLETLV